ncbi:MAG: VWA domain-containing protein [Vicinamibacterales bacterium]
MGGLSIAGPIVLHLLKREPESRVPFSAVYLLRRAPVEQASKRRLRELLLLALRVAALLLLALAFARPFLASAVATSAGTTVVAIDTSLSMSAPGQFEKARQLAKQAITDAPLGHLVAVVGFADDARVVSQASGDRVAAAAALDGLQAGAGRTRYRAGLNAAVDVLRGRPGTVVVVTDLQETGWDAGDRVEVPETVTVQVKDVGAPPANLAVTSARVAGDRIVATVRNGGPAIVTAQVHLNVNDGTQPTDTRVAASTAVPIGAGQTASVAFSAPKARWSSVSVDDAAGAAADNTCYIVTDAALKASVLIVSTAGDLGHDAFYLEQALVAAGSDGRAFSVEGAAAAELASWDQARLDAHTAIILLSTRALEHRGRELLSAYLKKGGGMLVAASADVDGDVLQEILAGPHISIVTPGAAEPGARTPRTWSATDVRHPVMRVFGVARGAMGLVQFQRVPVVRAPDCQQLARFTSGESALVDCPSGEGHAIVIASDLDNRANDFPLHATFVPFVHEAVHYLAGRQQRTSDYLVADVPAGVPPVPGIVPSPGGSGSLLAVNVDPAESDPARLSTDDFATAVTTLGKGAQSGVALQNQEQEERQHIWQYGLAAMLLVLALESVVAARIA